MIPGSKAVTHGIFDLANFANAFANQVAHMTGKTLHQKSKEIWDNARPSAEPWEREHNRRFLQELFMWSLRCCARIRRQAERTSWQTLNRSTKREQMTRKYSGTVSYDQHKLVVLRVYAQNAPAYAFVNHVRGGAWVVISKRYGGLGKPPQGVAEESYEQTSSVQACRSLTWPCCHLWSFGCRHRDGWLTCDTHNSPMSIPQHHTISKQGKWCAGDGITAFRLYGERDGRGTRKHLKTFHLVENLRNAI